MNPSDTDIEAMILALCLERGAGKTICPSEAARALGRQEDAWRALMPEVRRIAQGLAQTGRIAIFRKGMPLTDHDVIGVIRLGLPC